MNTLRFSLRASILLASVSPLLHADTLTVEGDLNTTGNVTIGTVSLVKNLNVTGDVTIAGALDVDGQSVVTVDQLATYVTTTQLAGYVTASDLSSAGYLTSSGSGASLTNLNADALAAGTISVDRLPAVVSKLGATIELNGAETTGLLSWSRVNKEDSSLADLVTRNYADLQGTPTTLSGYGITDAVAKNENGNVGIGTSAPDARLAAVQLSNVVPEYNSTGEALRLILDTTVEGEGPALSFQTRQGELLNIATIKAAKNANGGELQFWLKDNATGPFVQRVVFKENGNVGIGTNAPAEKLDVVGNAKISGTLTVGGNAVATSDQLANYLTSDGSGANLTNISATAITAAGTRDATTFLRGDNTWAVPPGGGGGSGVTDGDKGDITVSDGGAVWTLDGGLPLSRLATDPLARANHTGTQAWTTITGTPTTVATYGITDAVQKNANGDVVIAGSTTLTGAVTIDGVATVNKRVAKLRVEQQGDLDMGTFTAGSTIP